MYTCQCEVLQMGLSSDFLLKEMAGFQRCPLIEVLLYIIQSIARNGKSNRYS